jgi:hypothetical protein
MVSYLFVSKKKLRFFLESASCDPLWPFSVFAVMCHLQTNTPIEIKKESLFIIAVKPHPRRLVSEKSECKNADF